MYLKLIEQNNIDNIVGNIENCSRNNIIVIKYYDNIYVIINLKNYSILFLVKYKIHNSSDIEDIFNNIRRYLTKNLDNNFIDLKWNYYFKCNECTLNNLLLISSVYNQSNNKECFYCNTPISCNISTSCNKLVELPNNKTYHIDCINKNPECIYNTKNKDILLQCEFCNKYVLSKLKNIKYRKNVECKNYYWKEIINNSLIKDYNIFTAKNNNYVIINLRNKS